MRRAAEKTRKMENLREEQRYIIEERGNVVGKIDSAGGEHDSSTRRCLTLPFCSGDDAAFMSH